MALCYRGGFRASSSWGLELATACRTTSTTEACSNACSRRSTRCAESIQTGAHPPPRSSSNNNNDCNDSHSRNSNSSSNAVAIQVPARCYGHTTVRIRRVIRWTVMTLAKTTATPLAFVREPDTKQQRHQGAKIGRSATVVLAWITTTK